MAAAPPGFHYEDIFSQPNKQPTEYRLITDRHVKVTKLGDKEFLQVSCVNLDKAPCHYSKTPQPQLGTLDSKDRAQGHAQGNLAGPARGFWRAVSLTWPREDAFLYVQVDPEALTLLAREAMVDIAHLLRPSHLQQLRNILDDKDASTNDKFVALELLKNANIAAGVGRFATHTHTHTHTRRYLIIQPGHASHTPAHTLGVKA